RDEEDCAQLRELRRLHAEPADAEPAPRVVDRRAEENRDEAERDNAEATPDEGWLAIVAIVHAHDDAEHRDAEDGPHDLFGQEQIGALVALERHDSRRAVDHDDAEADQQDGRDEQDAIALEFSCHWLFATLNGSRYISRPIDQRENA